MAAPHTTLKIAASVRETSTTTGTGTLSLAGAVVGFQTFVAGIGDGALCPYFVRLRGGSEWEYGIGTIADGTPDTLARTTVLRGANGTSAVNFSAGIKDVWCGPHPAHGGVHVAAGAPSANDDNNGANGTFLPGSLWLDSSTGALYVLVDDTNGAAVWRLVSNQLQAESEVTISSGAITVTGDRHIVDTEGNAAQDTLTTINGGFEGARVLLRAVTGARDVDIPSGVGNITLPAGIGTGLRLTVDHYSEFAYNPANTTWYHVGGGFVVGQLPNLLLNGGFSHWYRQTASATAAVDDGYFAPKWYSLLQGAGATVAQTSGLSRSGATTAVKLVAGGTTNRFGVAQIVEARDSQPRRGNLLTLQAAVRPNLNAGSGNLDVRIALLEWTGTADAVTSDVVNSWTNSTFSTGQFFNSTSLSLVATAMFEVDHNTWSTISVTGEVSSSCNNLIALVWTEDAPAHAADYLEITEAGLYRAHAVQDAWYEHPNERGLCERFCYRLEPNNFSSSFVVPAYRIGTNAIDGFVQFPTMSTTPSFSHGITTWVSSLSTGSDEVDFFNASAGGYATISGALTFSGLVIGPNQMNIRAAAGTSFSGSAGNVGRFRIGGASTHLILTAEL